MPEHILFAFLRWGNCKYLPPFAERRFTGASSSCEITAPALDLPEHILVLKAAAFPPEFPRPSRLGGAAAGGARGWQQERGAPGRQAGPLVQGRERDGAGGRSPASYRPAGVLEEAIRKLELCRRICVGE